MLRALANEARQKILKAVEAFKRNLTAYFGKTWRQHRPKASMPHIENMGKESSVTTAGSLTSRNGKRLADLESADDACGWFHRRRSTSMLIAENIS